MAPQSVGKLTQWCIDNEKVLYIVMIVLNIVAVFGFGIAWAIKNDKTEPWDDTFLSIFALVQFATTVFTVVGMITFKNYLSQVQ